MDFTETALIKYNTAILALQECGDRTFDAIALHGIREIMAIDAGAPTGVEANHRAEFLLRLYLLHVEAANRRLNSPRIPPEGPKLAALGPRGICLLDRWFDFLYINGTANRTFASHETRWQKEFRETCYRLKVEKVLDRALFFQHRGHLRHGEAKVAFSLFASKTANDNLLTTFIFDGTTADHPAQLHFTGREQEILALVALGKTNREIGETLHISLETVKSHIRNLLAKTGTNSRAALVAKCGLG